MAGPRYSRDVPKEEISNPNHQEKADPPSISGQPWDPGGFNILDADESDGPNIWKEPLEASQCLDCQKRGQKTTRGVGEDPVCLQ